MDISNNLNSINTPSINTPSINPPNITYSLVYEYDYSTSEDESYVPSFTPEPYYYFNDHYGNSSDDSIIYNQILQESLQDDNPYINVLSDEGKKQLNYVIYSNNLDNSDNSNNSITFTEKICPITQDEFEENELIVQLPCKHYFSKLAIEKWLIEEQATCPICKFALKSKEIKKNITTQNPFVQIINNFEELAEEQISEEVFMEFFNDFNIETVSVSTPSQSVSPSPSPTLSSSSSEDG